MIYVIIFLVVALGSSTRLFGIENAMKYGVTIQSIDDALTIHGKIMELITMKNSYCFSHCFARF